MATQLETLEALYHAGANGTYRPEKDLKALVKKGFVEINPAVVTPEGVACRITTAGIENLKSLEAKAEAETELETQTEKVVTKGAPMNIQMIDIEMPVSTRKGGPGGKGRPSLYPFDSLEAGKSFFIEGGDLKKVAGATAAANRRHATPMADGSTRKNKNGEQVPKMEYSRRFVAKAVEVEGVAGVGVWRTK